jgi:hypothetical protein
MKVKDDLDARAESLRALLEEKYRLRGRTLEQALRRAGRRLPRRHRRQVAALLAARKRAEHPRLALQMDHGGILKGCEEVRSYLKSVDPVAARRERLLDLGALIGFYILATIGLTIAFLWWRGYL